MKNATHSSTKNTYSLRLFTRTLALFCCTLGILWTMACQPGTAEDLRALQTEARLQRQQTAHDLERQATEEREAASAEARKSRQQILADKESLMAKIASLQQTVTSLKKQVADLNSETSTLSKQEEELKATLSKSEEMVGNTVGVIRLNSKDMIPLITEDLQSGLTPPSLTFLKKIAAQTQFPGLDDLQQMVNLLFATIQADSEVALTQGTIIDRQGHTTQADILTLGCFSALYRLHDEVGFLNYSSAGNTLYALSRLPTHGMRSQIKEYLAGKSAFCPVDITKGGALLKYSHSLSLVQQISKGGLLVWPIIAIFCCAILLVCERIITLHRKHFNGDRLLDEIEEQFKNHSPSKAANLPEMALKKPLVRILQAGLQSLQQTQEELENIMQEAILKEIPSLERFLATLSMLAAIAPLLGLLGTVTGMIDTFQVITQFGTGDAKLMSGGISVALVTTMLGLMVAIPIMFAHTLLNRRVENHIGDLEEKAIAFVNIVAKYRG